jgi:hypothetical protein
MTVVGIHDWRSYEKTKDRFPNISAVREFVVGVLRPGQDDLAEKIRRLAQPALDAELIPWVSFKLRPDDVRAGRWDVALASVATGVPSGVRLIPWHEPENDMTAAEFTQMFDHIAGRIRQEGGGHEMVYSAMTYQYALDISDPEAWFPEKADVYAADVYSGKSFPLPAILPDHPGFANWFNARPDLNVPWSISERGFITGIEFGVRADAIRREAQWLREVRDCRDYIYWNTPGGEGSQDIVLDAEYGEPALARALHRIADEYGSGYRDGYLRAINDGAAALARLAADFEQP